MQPGTRLGHYTISAQIGAGGMGEVYRAKDERLDREVAIKVLPQGLRDSPELSARFSREARTLSQLNHPHVCTPADYPVRAVTLLAYQHRDRSGAYWCGIKSGRLL